MSYYQVHKIQPITERHVLLLGFAITTQKPTEICQVSCKNQSHISMCKRWHKQSSMCKRWHMQSSACKYDISRPIRLWHVSPIRLRYVSLTHPQTPINRSLPKTFRDTKIQKYKSFAGIKPQSLQELQELQP